ncbi:Uncharacterised protein [Chlamydia trachomatis]|nr:Uncharacterised protein [Chlamydia trachomatis]
MQNFPLTVFYVNILLNVMGISLTLKFVKLMTCHYFPKMIILMNLYKISEKNYV